MYLWERRPFDFDKLVADGEEGEGDWEEGESSRKKFGMEETVLMGGVLKGGEGGK